MIRAAELEAALAGQEDGAWNPRALALLDEHEEFPAAAVASLDEAGLAAAYVLGPDSRFPELVGLVRTVARRDLTVAIAHGKTFLGAVPVWLAGTPGQRDRLARRVRAGAPVCWGLTERDHGSDLLAGECAAVPDGDGWRLNGEKWLINNGTRARLASVLVRTGRSGGARDFSLFLVDRDRLPAGAWRSLPKIATHGIRGADISGFTLDRAPVPADALVGAPGDGMQIVLRSLQLTRTACTGLSLGAADHALRLAREFAVQRRLYGRTLAELPQVRRALGRAAAAALAGEAVCVVATRSVHLLPGEQSVTSAIAKAFVPTVVQQMFGELAELLGVRGFLTGPPGQGFAKLERDHRLCAVFDGSTVVNRCALLNQMPRLARLLRRGTGDADLVRHAADPGAVLPGLALDRLTLTSATGCSPVQCLPGSIADRTAGEHPQLAALVAEVRAHADRFVADAEDFVPFAGGLPSDAFVLAERYERLYAAAACLMLWRHAGTGSAHPLAEDALWPRAALARVLGHRDHPAYGELATTLLRRTEPALPPLDGALA